MKILLFILAYLHLGASQLESMLTPFQMSYEQAKAKYGDDYMEGIDFTQQQYNFEAVDLEEFDFIIVGSGPAGCVLTHRLSEHRNFNVLLLEAGVEAPVINDIPYLIPVWNLSPYSWNYNLEKDKHFGWGLINGTMTFPRGKGLGGTTITNYMLFTRGNKDDFEELARMGNDEWSWENMEKFVKAVENVQIERQDMEERGHFGLVTCGENKQRSVVAQSFVEALKQSGYDYVDYNGKSQIGASFSQTSRRNGLRVTAEKAYLRPIKKRPHVKILTRSLVDKVIIDENNVATGVTFIRDGQKYTVMAKKEVILSAGTFNSPQLLMLSGVGPKKELKKHGIPLKKDLPVGKTMYDHLAFFGDVYEADQPITIPLPTTIDMDELVENANGTLAFGYVESMNFIQTPGADKKWLKGRPDIEYLIFPGDFSADGGMLLLPSWGFSQEIYQTFFKQHEGKIVFVVIHMAVHPKSKGWLTLRSANINDPPVMYYPFLSRREDVQTLIDSIRHAHEVVKQPAMAQYGVRPVSTVFPLCFNFEFDSDKYWECALRTASRSLHHQVSTCRMGPKGDKKAVVDQQGRVHGIQRLRVVDASIYPTSLSAHTAIPSYVAGEKVAYDLKKEYVVKPVN